MDDYTDVYTEEERYSKEDIKASARFARYKDAVEALLEKDELYTAEEAEEIIENFMKGSMR